MVFRPDANHARMAKTCQRMAMPEVPASIFIDGTLALVQLDRNWIPEKDNSALYVRPVLFATGETLGVKPSETFRFIIETCPSAPYFSGSVDLIAEDIYVRAFPGGTGAAKCGGNYAGSMLASIEAQKKGFHNVLWLDGIERKYVEEAGLMNVAFVIDGTVVTPPLGGTILPGITRDSVLTLLRDLKLPVEERRITIDEVFDAHAKGTLQGAAGIGTAAVIAPLGRLRHKDREITIPVMGPDSPLMRAGAELEGDPLGQDRRSPRLVGGDLTGNGPNRDRRQEWMPYFALDLRRGRRFRQQAHAVSARRTSRKCATRTRAANLIMAGALGEPAGRAAGFSRRREIRRREFREGRSVREGRAGQELDGPSVDRRRRPGSVGNAAGLPT